MVVTFSGRWNQLVQIQGGTKYQTEDSGQGKQKQPGKRECVCVGGRGGGGGGGSRAKPAGLTQVRSNHLIHFLALLILHLAHSPSGGPPPAPSDVLVLPHPQPGSTHVQEPSVGTFFAFPPWSVCYSTKCEVRLVLCGGAGIAQWLERRTRDWKVAGSNPCWNGGRIFFSRVDFLCWLLFRYPFHPRVTTT